MTISSTKAPGDGEHRTGRLPGHIVVLGVISFLTAMSSAMVYGLLPVFLVRVLHTTHRLGRSHRRPRGGDDIVGQDRLRDGE